MLYVDNELCAEDRNALEKFVADNTDLGTELQLLKETALAPEAIIFSAKHGLYREELAPDNLRERMLLRLDNELETSQMNLLEIETASNDYLQGEWNILQQTKLDPNEYIVYEDKRSLYRHEKDNVIAMRFWRVAAAVILIGATYFIGVSILSKNKHAEEIAVKKQQNSPSQQRNAPLPVNSNAIENNAPVQRIEEDLASSQRVVNDITTNQKQQLLDKIVSASYRKQSNDPVKNDVAPVIKKEMKNEFVQQEVNKKQNNNLPKPYFENLNNNNSNKIASSVVKDDMNEQQKSNDDLNHEKKFIAVNKKTEPKSSLEETLTETPAGFAKHTVLDEANAETGNNSIFLISEESINRSKFSGLFKKVKRVLTRNANIKTGNSVKVAGFEIAIR
ncbi:MAG: hypothetical protein ABIT58_05360 [Ferruginibacter sp.]